jgi:hypothetical protein
MKNYTNPIMRVNGEARYQRFVSIANSAIGICSTPEHLLLLRQFVDCVDYDTKEVKHLIYTAQLNLELNHDQLVEDAITLTCVAFDVNRVNLLSQSRQREFVDARRCAIAIIHYFSRKTLVQISRIFNRDHATIINMVKTFNTLYESDEKFRSLCEQAIGSMWDNGYLYGGRLDKIQAKIKTKKNNEQKRTNTEARIIGREASEIGGENQGEQHEPTLQATNA